MNSFYGVLGSPGCRFYDPRLASSITLRGHEILQTTARWVEARGYRVIYGDTDSVFVWLGDEFGHSPDDFGKQLAVELNRQWRDYIRTQFQLESFLELQFETFFERFFMPKIRGQDIGSKKRYAGLVGTTDGLKSNNREVVYKGLESVRSDWTRLAQEFQRQVFERVFTGQEYKSYIREVVADLFEGKYDQDLVYRKRLRQSLDQYESITPPHVHAARLLVSQGAALGRGDVIEYVFTKQGVFPASAEGINPDYQHYVYKQLAPAVDGLLETMGTSIAQVIDRQLFLL